MRKEYDQESFGKSYFTLHTTHGLSYRQIALFGLIEHMSQKNGKCWPKNQHLTNIMGITDRNLQRDLKALKDANVIKIVRMDFDRLLYPLFNSKNEVVTPDDTPTPRVKKSEILCEEEYNKVGGLLTSWAKCTEEQQKCTSHKIAPKDKPQSKVIMRINKAYKQLYTNGLLAFYDEHASKLDAKWCADNKITRENVKNSGVSYIDAIKKHKELVNAGETKHGFRLLTKNLADFFLQTQKNRNTNEQVVTSWLLYWVCHTTATAERTKEDIETRVYDEIKPKYDKYKDIYKAVDKAFKVNRKKLTNDVMQDANKAIELAEQLIDHVWLNKSKFKILRTCSTSSTFGRLYMGFMETQQFMDKVHPMIFMRGRNSWNNMCAYFSKKEASQTAQKGWHNIKVPIDK